jgi:CRP-like cAMP-binding protein
VGFRFLPGAVSSALLAPVVDSRPGILTRIALLRVVLLGLGAAGVLTSVGLVIVLVITSLDAVVAAPYRPAQSLLLPTLARTPTQVSAGAAGVSMVKTLGQAVGALLGGVGVALVQPGAVMAVAAAVMIVAALLTVGLDRRSGQLVRVRGALKAGVAAIPRVLSHEEASPLVVASGLRTLVRGLWTALAVIVALELFDAGSSGVGVLNAAAGLGAAIALPITATLTGRSRLFGPCVVAFIAAGLTLSVIGALPGGVLVVVVVCAWGMSMALADATSLSLLHRLLDAPTVSRTVGVMESVKLGAEGTGAMLAPALVSLVGVRPALILAGVPLPATIAVSLRRLRRADRAAEGRGAIVALLHGASALRGLDMASLEDVAARARKVEFPAGTDVVRFGEPGDDFYVIETGEAEVLIAGFRVAQLGPGADFGERALLRSTTRAATVRTLTPVTLYAIDRLSFLSTITGQPPEALAGADVRIAHSETAPPSRPVSEVLADVPLLRELDRAGLNELVEGATIEDWEPGAVLIREGDSGSHMYVILSGRAQTTVGGEHVGELLPGDAFGEIAVMHDVARTATVAATESLRTCRLEREALTAILVA